MFRKLSQSFRKSFLSMMDIRMKRHTLRPFVLRLLLVPALAMPFFILVCCSAPSSNNTNTNASSNTNTNSRALQSCPADLYKKQSCGEHPKPPEGAKYGSQPGEYLGPFTTTLNNCEQNPQTLREMTCGAELILFNVGAGWCQPCLEETAILENMTHKPYCRRGLRIVQVLFQDDQSQLATSVFCQAWKQKYSLQFPVLIDPLQQTKEMFDYQTGTPLNLLVDAKTMKILFRWSGEVPQGLEQQIEAELKKRGK